MPSRDVHISKERDALVVCSIVEFVCAILEERTGSTRIHFYYRRSFSQLTLTSGWSGATPYRTSP